jgi:hypothetical protein
MSDRFDSLRRKKSGNAACAIVHQLLAISCYRTDVPVSVRFLQAGENTADPYKRGPVRQFLTLFRSPKNEPLGAVKKWNVPPKNVLF